MSMGRFGRSKRGRIILGAALAVLVAAIVVVNLRGRRERVFEVDVEKVAKGTVIEKVKASGKVQPEVQVKISANVSGRIERLGVKEGDRVAKGDFLVELDRTRYAAATERAEAAVRSAEADERLAEARLEEADKTLRRLAEISGKGLSSAQELDAATANAKVARAQWESSRDNVAQARALLEQAADELAKTIVVSPMEGVVSQLNSEVGEVVLGTSQFEGTTIMTIADLTRMEVEVEVDENDVTHVSLGDTAKIEVDAMPDTSYTGLVTEIANTAVTRGRGTQEEITSFPVKIAFAERVPSLRPGMSANVEVVTDSREDVVQVPIQAVTLREPAEPPAGKGGKEGEKREIALAEASEAHAQPVAASSGEPQRSEAIFVMKNGTCELRRVKTGLSGDTNIEILSGVEAGEEIIVGSYRLVSRELQDGNAVKKADASKKKKGGRGGRGGNGGEGEGGPGRG